MSCQLYSDNSDCLSLASSTETMIARQSERKDKPKRNRSAFIIFSSEMRSIMNSDEKNKVNSNEMMVKLADLWKNLKEGDKKRYQDMAEKEKIKYLTEINEYYLIHPYEVIQNKTKKNHVKKPCSAYGLFLREAKTIVKSERPDLKMADVLKVVADKWKNLDEKQKMAYQAQAQVEKEVVKSKMTETCTNSEENVVKAMAAPQKRIQSQKRVKKALIRENMKVAATETIRIDEVETSDSSPFEEAVFASHSHSENSPADSYRVHDDYSDEYVLNQIPTINFNWCRFPSMDAGYFNTAEIKQEVVVKKETDIVNDICDSKNKKSNDFLFDLLNFQNRKESYEKELYSPEGYTTETSYNNGYIVQPVVPARKLMNESLAQALDFGLNDFDFDCFNFENTYHNSLGY